MHQTLSWTQCTPGTCFQIFWLKESPHLTCTNLLGTSNFAKRYLWWIKKLDLRRKPQHSRSVWIFFEGKPLSNLPTSPVSKVAERARKPRLGWCCWHGFLDIQVSNQKILVVEGMYIYIVIIMNHSKKSLITNHGTMQCHWWVLVNVRLSLPGCLGSNHCLHMGCTRPTGGEGDPNPLQGW